MTSLRGNLGSVDLANIFQMLSLNQREGTLYIFDGTSRKAIWFGQQGVSMLSRGRHRQDTLGRILVRYDKLTPEQLEDALSRQDEASGRLLGHVLIETGVATREDVEDALKVQIEEEVYSLFIWKDAQFEFVEGPPDPELRAADNLSSPTFNVNSLIMEAARRVDEWEWIQGVVASTDEIYRYTGRNVELEDEIFGETASGKVLAAIDGKKSLEEVIEASYVNKFDACKIAALLLEGGAIEPLPVPELRREAEGAVARGDTDSAVKYLSRLVALKGDTPAMHRQLALVFEERRELERAGFHYRVYAEILCDQGELREAFGVYQRICGFLPTDLAAADRLIEIFATNPDGLEQHAREMIGLGKGLADIYLELRRQSRAIQVLHRVVALGPDDPDLRNRLIQVYLASGMPGEAIAEYDALAETAVAMRDLDHAERIYRKILSIDRTRDDILAKLNALVSKRRRRQRSARMLVAGAALAALGSGGAWYSLRYLQERELAEQQVEGQAGQMLAKLRTTNAPAEADLDALHREIAESMADPVALADLLAELAPRRAAVGDRVNRAIASYLSVVESFPGTLSAQTAKAAADQLQDRLGALGQKEDKGRQTLRARADELWTEIRERHFMVATAEKLDELLQRCERISRPCTDWLATEPGIRMAGMAKDVRGNLEGFRELESRTARFLERNQVGEAQRAAFAFLETFPYPDLARRVKVPRQFVSHPPGARIRVNGVDTGLRTPAVVSLPVHESSVVLVEADRFAPERIDLPEVGAVDPRELASRVQLEFELHLQKELVYHTQRASGRIEGAPAVAGELFVVPTRGGQSEVYDLESGTKRRTLPTRNPGGVRASPAAAGDVVALAGVERIVYFYRVGDGEFLKSQPLPGRAQTDSATWNGRMVLADDEGHVSAFDLARAARAWVWPPRGRSPADGFHVAPAVHGNEVYVATRGGLVFVLDAATGTLLREIAVRDSGPVPVSAPVAVDGDSLFAVSRDGPHEGRLVCVDRRSGALRFTVALGGGSSTRPVVWDGRVFVTTDAGDVVAVRVADGTGQVVSRHALGARVTAATALEGGVLYTADQGGRLTALDVRGLTIEPLWSFRVTDRDGRPVALTTSPVLTPRLILFGAADDCVYALRR